MNIGEIGGRIVALMKGMIRARIKMGLSKAAAGTRVGICFAAAVLAGAAPSAFADSTPGSALPGAAAIVYTQSVPCAQPTAATATHHRRAPRRRLRHRVPVKSAVRISKPAKTVKSIVVVHHVMAHHKTPVRHRVRLRHRRPAGAPLLQRASNCETLHRDQLANLPQLIAALYTPNLGIDPVAPVSTDSLDGSEPPATPITNDFAVLPSGFSAPGGTIAPFSTGGGGSSSGAPVGGGTGTAAPPSTTGPGGGGVVIIPTQPTGSGGLPGTGEGGSNPPSGSTPGSGSGGASPPVGGGVSTPPTVISAVPEPNTWFLLISGVALVGVQVRRRKRNLTRPGHLQDCQSKL
jgi:hypothetical protein